MPNGRLTEAIAAGGEAYERLNASGQTAAALHAYSQVGLARLSRRQESAADEAAANAVGSAATVAAFRELAPIAESWAVFLNNHLIMGWAAGYLPTDAFSGYGRLRASLYNELADLRANPPDEADPYDAHPPMSKRIAAIDALRAVGTVRVPGRERARPAA